MRLRVVVRFSIPFSGSSQMKEAEVVIAQFENVKIPTKRVAIVSQEKASRRFRQLRRGNDLTLREVAAHSGIRIGTISALEIGSMPWTNKSANKLFASLSHLIAEKVTA